MHVRLFAVPAAVVAGALLLPSSGESQSPPTPKPQPLAAAQPAAPERDPKAIEILKESSRRLAAAKTLSFKVVATEESPSRYGPALAYMTTSDVVLQRPNKLRVDTPGDGPASEFTYDGKTIVSFHPAENFVAVAEAPPTIDAMLDRLFEVAGTYFPFTDVIVADPYADLAKGLTFAFYIGRSAVVDGVTTDMVAYECNGVFVQLWVGAEDKLPRMARAVYADDPLQLRHQMVLSRWQVDPAVPAGAFTSSKAAGAKRIGFAHPKSHAPQAPVPAVKNAPPEPTPKSR
jgi:hypothetical protein